MDRWSSEVARTVGGLLDMATGLTEPWMETEIGYGTTTALCGMA